MRIFFLLDNKVEKRKVNRRDVTENLSRMKDQEWKVRPWLTLCKVLLHRSCYLRMMTSPEATAFFENIVFLLRCVPTPASLSLSLTSNDVVQWILADKARVVSVNRRQDDDYGSSWRSLSSSTAIITTLDVLQEEDAWSLVSFWSTRLPVKWMVQTTLRIIYGYNNNWSTAHRLLSVPVFSWLSPSWVIG